MTQHPVAIFLLKNEEVVVFLCYVDESGTEEIPGNTPHFVLTGLAIPENYWKQCDAELTSLKERYKIKNSEIHTAWMLRHYIEQKKIPNFENLDYNKRRSAVISYRNQELYRLQKSNKKSYHQAKKNFRKTEPYIHLSYKERKNVIRAFADKIKKWDFARLFAKCIDKVYFDPSLATGTVYEQAFEQVVSRFEQYLQIISNSYDDNCVMGILIHDNNQTVAKKLTELMKNFHKKGTLWTNVDNIIETPLFVDSQLTSMVQASDLCSYAIRRYLENKEEELFKRIFTRADRKDGRVVGVRHFSYDNCICLICQSREKSNS